jgi:hypothetical protein
LANNFDVKWVMAQVGHADSTMTIDVYAQLGQRVVRSHGTSFDRLVNEARMRLYAADVGHGLGHDPHLEPARDAEQGDEQGRKPRLPG